MQWSAQHAFNAYLQTLAMVKLQESDITDHRMVEPKCMELISAMAAGRQAKLMVEITTMQGITPFTVALAIAAKHTGGQLISCISLADDDTEHNTTAMETQADFATLRENVAFLHGASRAKEMLSHLKVVEFLAIDCKLQDQIGSLLRNVEFSLKGWTVVAYNVGHNVNGSISSLLSQALYRDRGIRWIPSLILPIGEGVELIKYDSALNSRRRNRFYVTVEN